MLAITDAETEAESPACTQVVIQSDADIVTARQLVRALASQIGFTHSTLTMISAAVSELARNILHYARRGEIILKPARTNGTRGITIMARDKGPGIPNIEQAMQDGFSTSGSLGLGLPGVRRLMDEFEIASEEGRGTTVLVRKWKQ